MSKSTLRGKTAVITGSSMGIGRAIAVALAEKGVNIVLNGRNPEKLTNTANDLTVRGYQVLAVAGDVGRYADCENLVRLALEKFGSIDILVNNAGIGMEGSIAATAPAVFERVFRTNLLGVIYPTKAALPWLLKSKGSIVFTGSIAGYMGLPGYSAYSASKMALTALVQSLKIELAGTGVHVGINYVGFTENDDNKTFINRHGENEPMPERKNFKRMTQAEVAAYFVRGIEQRKYKQTLSQLGKLTRFAHRFIPGIFEKLMIRKYRQQQK